MGAAFERGFTQGLLKYQAEENAGRTTFNSEIDAQILLLNMKSSKLAAGLYKVAVPEMTEKNAEIYKNLNNINSKIAVLKATKKETLNIRIEMNIDLSSHQIDYPDKNSEKSYFMMAQKLNPWEKLFVQEKRIGGSAIQIGINPDGTSPMTQHYGPVAPPVAMPESDTKPVKSNP